ncbi:hypothetical protein BDD12DRAFT_524048 [Trichophaea hybrida]|nr:hypothetical protein BDD12DRAFT_524048 [Trichophaea hybrida]
MSSNGYWGQAPYQHTPPFQAPHPPFQSPPAEYHQYAYTNVSPQSQEHQAPHTPHYSQFPPQQHYYHPPPPPQHHSQPPPQQHEPNPRYADPRSPLQQAFNPQVAFPPIPGSYDAYDYQIPDISALNLDERPSSPQYVGRRARSRASSKAGSTATRPTSRVEQRLPRGRMKQIYSPLLPPPGYKKPYVETAPNSPLLLPSLSSDAGSVLEPDDNYINSLPKDPPTDQSNPPEDSPEPKRRKRPVPLKSVPTDHVPLERIRTPYTNSSGTASTAASSSPPSEKVLLERERRQYSSSTTNLVSLEMEHQPDQRFTEERQSADLRLERERRQYSNCGTCRGSLELERERFPYPSDNTNSMPPEAIPRQSQPYSSASSTPSRRSQYASSTVDLTHPREDLRPYGSPHSPQVPPSPRHHQSPQIPDSPHYAPSQLHPKSPQSSTTSRIDTPTPSEPSPTSPPQESFAQSLVARSSTPQSEFLDLIPACPKRRPVSRGDWYGVPSIPNFHVCEKCYELYIYDTAFVKYFHSVKLAKGEKAFCAFNTPRVLNFVWPKTVEASLFEIFQNYATERSKIGTCTGMDASAKQGVWYMVQGSSRKKFIACQACYQDVILASPFHQFFGPLEATVTENTTSCHVAWPFIEARLLNNTSTWDEIQRDIDYRLHKVPACPGDKLIKDPGRRWWKPKDTPLPVYICDCCYWDGIFPTQFAGDFDLVTQEPRDEWCCAMSGYQLSTVWQYAAEKEDIKPWVDAANAALSPMCSPHGSSGKIWNVFKDPALDGIDFCERCTDVFIRPLGFGKYLEKRRYSANEIIQCDLNPAKQHQRETLQKLGEAAAWREFAILKEYLARLAQIAPQLYTPPPCPGTEPFQTRWWGCEGFVVCEECWLFRVNPSGFGSHFEEFELKDDYTCDLGTPEWRYIWQKRCDRRELKQFLEAIMLKNKLDDVRFRRSATLSDFREKSRRRLFPDEKRRLSVALSLLEEEERDTTNMLAALTRV